MVSPIALRLFFGIAHLMLSALPIDALAVQTDELLVCSGPMPVGKIVSQSGSYYGISDKASNASGKCQCDSVTSKVTCSVTPRFPVGSPQGTPLCQKPGATTCNSPDTVLCANGKPVGTLNSQGAVTLIGSNGGAKGYCQCSDTPQKPWQLACPEPPAFPNNLANTPISCSKLPDCSGLQ